MADVLMLEFRGKTDKFIADSKAVTDSVMKSDTAVKKFEKDATQAYNKAGTSAKGFSSGVQGVKQSFNTLGPTIASVGAQLGIAFSVQKVIEFGKASAQAYLDAEKNAQLLLFALKGNSTAQQRLLDQASQLQNTTVFDDDSIIQAQTFLATNGRNEAQIRKIIDAAVELSTVTGVDLQSAVMQLDATYEGSAGRLGKLDSAFKDLTVSQLQNGAAVDLIIEKYKGQAEAMGDTNAGKVAKLKNQFGELQEKIGKEMLPAIKAYADALESLNNGDFNSFLETLNRNITDQTDGIFSFAERLGLVSSKFVDGLTDMEKAQLKIINATEAEISVLRKEQEQQGLNTAEFDKFVKATREAELNKIFDQLSQSLEISRKQFEGLVAITDKYGISARITSDQILGIKQATDGQLKGAFERFHNQLGVSQKDWDDYIGKVKDIPPLQNDVADTTKKMVGPYEQLSAAVSKAMKALQDQATLFIQGKADWQSVIDLTGTYADNQNELVAVNTAVADSLKRQVRETLELVNANQIVMLSNTSLVESFKFTDEQIAKRDEIFKNLGVNQVDSYSSMLDQIYKLQADEIRATDGTLAAIKAVTEKYAVAITEVHLKQTGEAMTAMGDLAGALSGTLAAIFGDAAQKNAEFASFIQALTITEILFKQGAAIANSIEKITTSTNPFDIISGIAGIVASIGGVFSGIAQSVSSTQVPEPPSFFDGTPDTGRGGTLDSRGGFWSILHPHEAVIPGEENTKYPGLSKAWITGSLDDYIVTKWVAPALKEQERQLKKEFTDNLAASIMLQQGSAFDDYRLFRTMQDANSINRNGFAAMVGEMKKRNKRRGGYA